MKTFQLLLAYLLIALAISLAFVYDPSPLQDFCVATNSTNGLFVNGRFCKNPKDATVNDFIYRGYNIRRNPTQPSGSITTTVNVNNLPGLNTIGISLARVDYAVNGVNPPHIHPRSSETLSLSQGTIFAGFITSDPNNTLFGRIINEGDIFVIPQGLIHFEFNVGKTNAVAFPVYNSQNPGMVTIPNAIFGSNPRINVDVLARAFQVNASVVRDIQAKF